MIRLLLFILPLCLFNIGGTANERTDSSREVIFCDLSASTSEYNLCDKQEIGDGIISSSSNDSNLLPDVKKNLFSDYRIIDEIKSNGFYFTEPNLFFLIRKDNIFLSILRI